MSDYGKDWRPTPRASASNHFAERAHELRTALQLRDLGLIVARSGVSYFPLGPDRGEFRFPLWGTLCIVTWPEFIAHTKQGDSLPSLMEALLLYYLLTSDGTPQAGKWVSFADLPFGRMYAQAFQGYSGDEIVKLFGLNLDLFKSACEKLSGHSLAMGDAAYQFHALPRVDLLIVYHLGDEDFPSSCKILFDASATHYLPIDACAILGSMLTRKILSALA